MRTWTRFAMAICLVAVVALVCEHAYAAEKGNISGNVLTLDGKPAAAFVVKLTMDKPLKMTRPGRGKTSGSDSGATGLQGGDAGTKVVSQTTADATGKFTFNNVEVGQYRLEGGNKNVGWLYYDVSVEANKTTDMKDMKLVKLN